ncbi:hypothetical protein [Compostibacter hankyongensis]|uniref:Uncharacterized protein n=1 Tax=Compostibacter hankyongensis TaxID=1007089 RepID=A0ABP8FBW8_9BACT
MAPKRKRFFVVPLFVIAALLLLGAVVMLLWNAVLPQLFNVPRIGYGRALGLLVLCRILFGSFRPGSRGGFRRGGPPWKNKFMNLSPEERERFKQEWRQRRSSRGAGPGPC